MVGAATCDDDRVHLRLADDADVPVIAATLALAFADDPVWGPILRRPDGDTSFLEPFWSRFVEGALPYGNVWVVDDGDAVAVWLPSGEPEMTDEQFAAVEAIVADRLDAGQRDAFDGLMAAFDANHPHEEPHMYLSLLASNPARRGEGLAQRMLAENLRAFAAAGLPAYLESTNPANDRRYERAGFRRLGGFTSPLDGAPVTTMWRAVDA